MTTLFFICITTQTDLFSWVSPRMNAEAATLPPINWDDCNWTIPRVANLTKDRKIFLARAENHLAEEWERQGKQQIEAVTHLDKPVLKAITMQTNGNQLFELIKSPRALVHKLWRSTPDADKVDVRLAVLEAMEANLMNKNLKDFRSAVDDMCCKNLVAIVETKNMTTHPRHSELQRGMLHTTEHPHMESRDLKLAKPGGNKKTWSEKGNKKADNGKTNQEMVLDLN